MKKLCALATSIIVLLIFAGMSQGVELLNEKWASYPATEPNHTLNPAYPLNYETLLEAQTGGTAAWFYGGQHEARFFGGMVKHNQSIEALPATVLPATLGVAPGGTAKAFSTIFGPAATEKDMNIGWWVRWRLTLPVGASPSPRPWAGP